MDLLYGLKNIVYKSYLATDIYHEIYCNVKVKCNLEVVGQALELEII